MRTFVIGLRPQVARPALLENRHLRPFRAIDAEAEAFWRSWGFVPARDNPSVLMRSIDDIRAWLSDL